MTAKEQAQANLLALKRTADASGARFFLLNGTLLGAVRDGDFCEGDADDVDVGFMDDDYGRAVRILRKMDGFEGFKPCYVAGRLEGLGLRRGASYFDLIRVNLHPSRPEAFFWQRGGFAAYVYSDRHFTAFEELEFLGETFAVPYDAEGYLEARYGDWRTPVNRLEYREELHLRRDCVVSGYSAS